MGRMLKVEIDYIAVPYYKQGISQHPILSTRSLFSYMLCNGYSKLLLGGYDIKTDESRTVLLQWWERYRVYDPGHPGLRQQTIGGHGASGCIWRRGDRQTKAPLLHPCNQSNAQLVATTATIATSCTRSQHMSYTGDFTKVHRNTTNVWMRLCDIIRWKLAPSFEKVTGVLQVKY